MISFRLTKYLRFMFQPAEGLGRGDPVNVALKTGADVAGRFWMQAAGRLRGQHAIVGKQNLFRLFMAFSWTKHKIPLFLRKNNILYKYYSASTRKFPSIFLKIIQKILRNSKFSM